MLCRVPAPPVPDSRPAEGGGQGIYECLTLPASPARLREAAELIVLERICCPSSTLPFRLAPGSSAFELSVTGSEGTRRFVQAEFNSMLPVSMSF
jgi:hypothetical protein